MPQRAGYYDKWVLHGVLQTGYLIAQENLFLKEVNTLLRFVSVV